MIPCKRPVTIFLISVLVLTAVSFLGCGKDGNNNNTVELRLAYRPKALADITPVILKEFNLSQEGLSVTLVPVPSPPAALQKLSAGEVDAVAGIPLSSILAQLEGDSAHFTAYYHQVDLAGEGWVSLVGNPSAGVNSIEDLAGKPAAALPTDQAQWLLRRILEAAGIGADEVDVVIYNPANPLAGLAAGEHAAIFGLEPAISKAVDQGYVILAEGPVSSYLYDNKPVIVSASLISDNFKRDHPDAVTKFVGLIEEAVSKAKTEPDSVRILFTERDYGELSPNVASHLFLPVMVRPSPENRMVASEFVKDLVNDGLLSDTVNLDRLFPE